MSVIPIDKLWFDIGHGVGNVRPGVFDPGADPPGWPQEHGWVEGFVEPLAAMAQGEGYSVLVTEDMYVGSRDDKAKAAGADLGLSFHMDAFDKKASGTTVFVNSNADTATRALAGRIAAAIAKTLDIPNRGVKERDNLGVLRALPRDMLVELIFIDNAEDRAAFSKSQQKLRVAVLEEIVRAFPPTGGSESPPKPVPAYRAGLFHNSILDSRMEHATKYCEDHSIKLYAHPDEPGRTLALAHCTKGKLGGWKRYNKKRKNRAPEAFMPGDGMRKNQPTHMVTKNPKGGGPI